MDILVHPDSENVRRILHALDEFGFGSLGLTAEDFTAPDKVVQLDAAPVRIDIVTAITGVPWAEAAAGAVEGNYGDVTVRYIGKKEFIVSKRALGRKKDLAA